MKTLHILTVALAMLASMSCNSKKAAQTPENNASSSPVGPTFNADSAYAFCETQCQFGPRIVNTEAHDRCGEWIAGKFRAFGMSVIEQKADLKGYDGATLKSTNIIASYKPELTDRILLCAHWDTRPWADNDPDSANWRKPVLGANDGASGVAVLLEIARTMAAADSILNVGVDFICFDAEDRGTPMWDASLDDGHTWALGSQYWSSNPHKEGYAARFGILLDMVGGKGARFYQEGFSRHYAQQIVDKVWMAAQTVGFGSHFPVEAGGTITDDHVAVNEQAGIPTIDIIAFYPDCEQSTFGPTWHTVRDDMEGIDKQSLQAAGQTVIQVLYSER